MRVVTLAVGRRFRRLAGGGPGAGARRRAAGGSALAGRRGAAGSVRRRGGRWMAGRGAAFRCRAPSSSWPAAAICHSRSRALRLLYALLVRLRAQPEAMERRRRPAAPPARGDGEGRAARHAQDARLPPLPGDCDGRFVAWFEPDASYRPRQCRLLRPPLRHDALVDPDARTLDPLGRRDAVGRPRRSEGGRAAAATRSRRCGRPITPRSSIRRG